MKPFILAIITARGGSKGVPGKNIKPLCGHPLIAYTIKAAQKCSSLNDFLVSTDSEEIAEVAARYGAKPPFLRPGELARDDTPSCLVLQHALLEYEKLYARGVDVIVLLQPTTPLRTAHDIDMAVEMFLKAPEADSLISCFADAACHPRVMYTMEGDRLVPLLEDRRLPVRRQDFEKVYLRNGAVYITKRETLMKKNTIIGDSLLCYEMPFIRSVNIDEPGDFRLAEVIMREFEKDRPF